MIETLGFLFFSDRNLSCLICGSFAPENFMIFVYGKISGMINRVYKIYIRLIIKIKKIRGGTSRERGGTFRERGGTCRSPFFMPDNCQKVIMSQLCTETFAQSVITRVIWITNSRAGCFLVRPLWLVLPWWVLGMGYLDLI